MLNQANNFTLTAKYIVKLNNNKIVNKAWFHNPILNMACLR